MTYLKDLWARVQVRWHIVLAAAIAALPEVLNWLGVVDLRPILTQILPTNYVDLIVGVLPFVLAFLKPMVHLAPEAE